MAIKSQGLLLKMETARAVAKTITGITNASPANVTAAAHGYAYGDIIYIDSVSGMTAVNGRAFVAYSASSPTPTGTFQLRGVDTSDTSVYGAYASGGSAYKITATEIAQVEGISGFDGESPEIDVTNLRSIAKEYLLGLQDFGNITFPIFLANSDAGQTALRTAKESGAAKVFTMTDSAGAVCAFVGRVKSFTFEAQKDGAVRGSVTIRVTSAPAWFA